MKEDARKKYGSSVKAGGIVWHQTTFVLQPLGVLIFMFYCYLKLAVAASETNISLLCPLQHE